MQLNCLTWKPADTRCIIAVIMTVLTIALLATRAGGATPPLSAIAISDSVEKELSRDQAIPAYRLDVVTVDGLVTLSGSVDNILAKERAARIAMTVKGVRAVVNKIKVRPLILRDDIDIHNDIIVALLNDPATESYEVDVAVDNNAVTLTGTVDSLQEKALAETVAKGVSGVTAVDNNIEVKWRGKRSDAEIKADIQKALEWNAYVDHGLIVVKVDDGIVTLSGIVGSAAEKRLARLDAFVNGVKAVDDTKLKVERWARDEDLRKKKYVQKSEEEIRRAVEDALLYDPRVSSFKITTEVSGNSVTLRGTVDNLKARRAAAQDARNTVGVQRVDNRIKVRPKIQLGSQSIEKKIEDALLRDPYVSGFQIEVDVTVGVANLSGIVDSYFEKLQAEDIASKVRGVIVVDNNLMVRKDYDPYVYDPYVEPWYLDDYDWYRYRFSYPKMSDAEIKEEINDEFFWSPFVDADDVEVEVNAGTATLSGTVDSWSEYWSAEENAYEGGAVFVDNDLIVVLN